MKKLLLAAAFLLPFMVKAQTSGPYGYKVEDKYVYYGAVVQVDTSFSVSDLYKDAKLFITKMGLANEKITTDDKMEGIVALDVDENATFKTETGIGSEPMEIKYSIKLELKKGRYRYTFDNIIITFKDSNGKNTPHSLYDLDQDKGGGIFGVGRSKRVLKTLDELFLSKIDLLTKTMSKKSDDF
jgi:hypothetical protein